MNQATLFLLHLKMLHDAKEPVPNNSLHSENITLLKKVLADFSEKTGSQPENIFAHPYMIDVGQCERIEIEFSDGTGLFLTESETKVCLPAPKKHKAGGA